MAFSDKNPIPLWFQVPTRVLHDALRSDYCEIGPGFLCFESFYQSVALTWPHEYNIIDIGGYVGVQGWLFRHFQSYIDVNTPLEAKRCVLPPNGRHVEADGFDYISRIRQFDVDLSHDLFICSAVPNGAVRDAVRSMPNHVVWYPGMEIDASGPYSDENKALFRHLGANRWDSTNERLVFASIGRRSGQNGTSDA